MDELIKILDAAENLFLKYGIRSVSMSDIASDLGMSKKTLYVHIENKDDLIEKIAKRHLEQERQAIEAITRQSENALDEMLRIAAHVQQHIQTINPTVIFDLQKYHRPIWEQFENYQKGFVYVCVKENLERGLREGLYRDDLHTDIISKIYINSIPIFTDMETFPPHQYSQLELHHEFMKYHLQGILSDKGRAFLAK